jgi:hypothetical protein
MPSTDRKLELKGKTSVAQTASQAAVSGQRVNAVIAQFLELERRSCYMLDGDSVALTFSP